VAEEQAAIAGARIDSGFLAYISDVNSETKEADTVILALYGVPST
jgi:hypothetical protein